MAGINPLNQSLFVNQQAPNTSKLELSGKFTDAKTAVTIEADFVQSPSPGAMAQADELFSRANTFSKHATEYPVSIQQSLQAYTSLEVASKRDEISSLMGVDLYA